MAGGACIKLAKLQVGIEKAIEKRPQLKEQYDNLMYLGSFLESMVHKHRASWADGEDVAPTQANQRNRKILLHDALPQLPELEDMVKQMHECIAGDDMNVPPLYTIVTQLIAHGVREITPMLPSISEYVLHNSDTAVLVVPLRC